MTIPTNDPSLWLDKLKWPEHETQKYARGYALIYGDAVMTGAARLAARAAQRMGVGLVTVGAAAAAQAIFATALESIQVRPVASIADWQRLVSNPKRTALLIGPGLSIMADTKALTFTALATKKPCVVDAGAMMCFEGEAEELFSQLHENCVLTPHEGEFLRLFGQQVDQAADKAARAIAAAKLAGCIVVLKGADTIIAAPDGSAICNSHATPWLATAGSGDVLAGMIVSLLAQGMAATNAAAAAVWMHGDSARAFGPGLVTEDIVAGLPGVWRRLAAMR